MPAFSKVVSVTGSYPALSAPDVDLSAMFVPDEYEFINEGAADVLVSFDGVNDHEKVYIPVSTKPLSIKHRTQARKVWTKGGGTLRVTARTDV